MVKSYYTSNGQTYKSGSNNDIIKSTSLSNREIVDKLNKTKVNDPNRNKPGSRRSSSSRKTVTKPKVIAVAVGQSGFVGNKTVVRNLKSYLGNNGIKRLKYLNSQYGRLTVSNLKTRTVNGYLEKTLDIGYKNRGTLLSGGNKKKGVVISRTKLGALVTPSNLVNYNSPYRRAMIVGSGNVFPVTSPTALQNELVKLQSFKNENLKTVKALKNNIGGGTELIKVQAGAHLVIYTVAIEILKTAQDISYLPATVKAVYRNPAILKELPNELYKSGQNYLRLWETSPLEAVVTTASFIIVMRGLSKAIGEVSKLSRSTLTRLNPKFKGVGRPGSTIILNVAKNKKVKLNVVASIPKSRIKRQIMLAGRRVNAISSQSTKLVGKFLKKTLRKSIPGEAKFTKATKLLLKKFDSGKITKLEFSKLNNRLIKVEKVKGLLERSFFADPTGKIRPSRLGTINNQVSKNLRASLSRSITFRKPRPQILFFNNMKVANFPKYLKSIKNKISKGVKLTNAEADKLLEWQLSKPGEFKPLGFITGESEITLPPGSIIKKDKVLGYVLINSKKVPIIQTKVINPSGILKNLLSKWKKGLLSNSEIKKLDRYLKRSTGFNYGLSYSPKVNARYIPIKRILASGAIKSMPKYKVYSRSSKSSSKVRPSNKPSRLSKVSKLSRASKLSRTSKLSKTSRLSRTSKSSKTSRLSRASKSRTSRRTYSPISTSKYSPRSISKLKTIYGNSKRRKRTKFSKEEVKYMVKLAYPKNKYRPSLAALIYNITSFKVPKKLTGFEIRPIIKRRR